MVETLPAGFRRATGSGLIVPEAQSREREVWTGEEYRALERATKLLRSRSIQVFLRCDHKECQSEKMERIRAQDGGLILRCAHKDRVFPTHLK